jgi:predicted O-methyltransferase YrrM
MVEDPVRLGYPGWGSGSIRDSDWLALKTIIDYCNVKSILEIGIGLSTLLMQQTVNRYVGYDTLTRHIDWMKDHVQSHVELRQWDGKTPFDFEEKFDLAFVDGPTGAKNRFPSFQSAIWKCCILTMHDTGYIWDGIWRHDLDPEEKYKCIWPGGSFSAWAMQ